MGVLAESVSSTSIRVTWKWRQILTVANLSACVRDTCVEYLSSAGSPSVKLCSQEALTERVVTSLVCGISYTFRVEAKIATGDKVISKNAESVPGGEDII